MNDIKSGTGSKAVVLLLRGLGAMVDVILYIPSLVFQNPWRTVKDSKRVKARCQSNDAKQPWRAADHFDSLTTTPFEGLTTLGDVVDRCCKLYSHRPCYGSRQILHVDDEKQPNGRVFKKLILGDYKWESFRVVGQTVDSIGQGLIMLGLHPGDRVCVFMETRQEWMLTAFACFKYNFQLVTIYSTLGEEGILYGINETKAKVVVTSAELLAKLQRLGVKMPKLCYGVYWPSTGVTDPPTDIGGNIQVYSMDKIMDTATGTVASTYTKPKAEDVAIIMYTSGTTGTPKGVIMTHTNILAALSGLCQRIPDLGQTPGDRYIAYLPLAHVLELSCELGCFLYGIPVGYSSPGTITDQSSMVKKGSTGDATELKPTLIACVPTVMDRIYKTILDKVNSGGVVARILFQFAFHYKKRNYNWGMSTPLLDRLVFSKIQRILGGSVRLLLCGSAPLNTATHHFMRLCFGCPIGQGYGLTETCGAGTVQEVWDRSVGAVGHPLWCNQILLRDWDEGGYRVTNARPQGEVLIGGANVAKGYFNMPDKNQEDFTTIDNVNYFCTGDIAEILPDGNIKIIDRKKDLVKLQHGEYISLGKVECALKMIPAIDNVCVYGDSQKDFVVALVQPNVKHLNELAEKEGLKLNWEELCTNEAIKKKMIQLIQEKAKEVGLDKFETPQVVMLCPDPWTAENGLISDTLKLKRKNIETTFRDDLQQLYQ